MASQRGSSKRPQFGRKRLRWGAFLDAAAWTHYCPYADDGTRLECPLSRLAGVIERSFCRRRVSNGLIEPQDIEWGLGSITDLFDDDVWMTEQNWNSP